MNYKSITEFSAREWGANRPEFYYSDNADDITLEEGIQWMLKSGGDCINTTVYVCFETNFIKATHELLDGSKVHREISITFVTDMLEVLKMADISRAILLNESGEQIAVFDIDNDSAAVSDVKDDCKYVGGVGKSIDVDYKLTPGRFVIVIGITHLHYKSKKQRRIATEILDLVGVPYRKYKMVKHD